MRRVAGTAWSVRVLAAAGLALVAGAPAGAGPAIPAGGAASPHAEAAPPGHTGGFGEPTCWTCHSEFPLGIDGRLTVEGLPERWEPGATYTVTLVVESSGMERAGFQASFRYAAGPGAGGSAGKPRAAGEGVVVTPGEGGVTYVGHAPGALWTDGAGVASWTFTWTAPDEPAGPVAFHAAANSANGDNSPFGDVVYAAADTVSGPATTPSAPSAP